MPNQPYEIVLIEEGFAINAAGKLENVKVIHYRTIYNDTGTIKISVDNYTAELAKVMLDADVSEHMKLRGYK